MPYKALDNWIIKYLWNNINASKIIDYKTIDNSLLENRVSRVKNEEMFFHIANIDDWIFNASVQYFMKIWAKWTNLPLTTLMISSPWEVYAGQKLDYTTDTLPIEIPSWFWNNKRIFLSESSQFYLELNLLIKWLDQVFSIYNSFRKEKSDATHLSEFQHIEYEWKVDLEWDIKVFMWLFEYIFDYLIKNNKENLLFFLTEEELNNKIKLVNKWPIRIWFREALNLLYKETWDEKYKDFSLKNFWTWEEVKLTEILKSNVIVEKFPMLQIPFYHAIAEEEINWVPVAKNADFILYWYRETIWAWERIKDKNVLLKKAEIFNLPENDYLPYLQTRDFLDYEVTSWFWLGWQRLTQWITNQPYIYEATVFPRTHLIPNP
ncbi:MAG: hypothetical protein ACD_49C00026G0012 [uncultured bacterium (gcode 4)]|uniref:Aminoacyl-tRNA synthetase class II (D/K/N) domain-containing protein n=1 Tax=uncultured bacterium (gcode 4) TaxID=1234023 RepID=K2AY66_9BACT|nr:MAG: hypothetical protein ACD_49C00026G0012 [uncultured bacterium (gcode 4)]